MIERTMSLRDLYEFEDLPDYVEIFIFDAWYELEQLKNYKIIEGCLITLGNGILVGVDGMDYVYHDSLEVKVRYEDESESEETMQDLSISQLLYIKDNLICSRAIDDDSSDGSCYWQLTLYRGQRGNIELLVTYCVGLAMSDSIAHEEIIDLDKNPELFGIFDWKEGDFVLSETLDCLEHIEIAGSVSQFGDQSPTTAINSH